MAAFVNLRDAVLARAAKAVLTRCRNMELPRSFNGVRTCSMIAALRQDAKDGMPECSVPTVELSTARESSCVRRELVGALRAMRPIGSYGLLLPAEPPSMRRLLTFSVLDVD